MSFAGLADPAVSLLQEIQTSLADYQKALQSDTPAQAQAMQTELTGWLAQFASGFGALAQQVFGADLYAVLQSAAAASQTDPAQAISIIESHVPQITSALTSYTTANPGWASSAAFTGAVPGQSAPEAGPYGTPTPVGTYSPAPGATPGGNVTAIGNNPTGQGGSDTPGTLAAGGTPVQQTIGTPTTATGAIEASVDAWAQSVGLGSLAPWINAQITTLAGEGMAAADIATTISDTINKAPGFDALMPGYNQRIANGYTNTDASTGAGIAGYLAYRQQLLAMAETAGVVPGTLSLQDIGDAWARDVSTAEMSDRITTEFTNAMAAAPAIQAELQRYGYVASLTPGQVFSYYLNPENTTNILQQQYNSAVAGGEGVLTGFGEIGQSRAYALQSFLSNGGNNVLTPAQAASFFSGSVAPGTASLAAMAQTGFEGAEYGQAPGGPGTVSQDTLLQAGMGNAKAILDVQRAAQTRAASSSGGGGLAADQAGVEGVGFGSM